MVGVDLVFGGLGGIDGIGVGVGYEVVVVVVCGFLGVVVIDGELEVVEVVGLDLIGYVDVGDVFGLV